MSETYFITGAQGCIGSWIIKALVERGDDAVVFDRSEDDRRLRAIIDDRHFGQVRFVTGDLADASAVRLALKQSDGHDVIRLAGLQVPSGKADPVAGAMVNAVGTLNLFEGARGTERKGVFYSSSA